VSIEYAADSTLQIVATTSAIFFTNPHVTLCGAINSCSLKLAGCSGDYTNANLAINAVSGEITAKKNVDAGYDDTVCISCSNTGTSTITHDNWKVTQKPNCETLTAETLSAKDYAYDTSATATVVWTYLEAFGNTKRVAPGGMPWSVCPITSCTVKQSDCSTALVAPFDGLVSVDSSTYSLKMSQTQASGYPDVVVCYACTNYGHTVTN
jgi:hypothetical protein